MNADSLMKGMQIARVASATHPCRMWLPILLTILLTATLSTPAPVTAAAIYKCIDASGSTTYTGTACADDESTSRITRSATAVPGLDCRIARKFADKVIERMNSGDSSTELFDSYGGTGSLSPVIITMVSYIYSFDGDTLTAPSRIATLATERCQVGSFGPDAHHCTVYPTEFIQEQGGCDAALQDGSARAGNAPETVHSGESGAPQTASAPTAYALPALGEATPDAPAAYRPAPPASASSTGKPEGYTGSMSGTAECQERLKETLAETTRQMQAFPDEASQDMLRDRQRRLQMQLNRC
jgi:hypothetical protein